jgi:hypothetical protein
VTDDRDICERLEDKSINGAIFLRINAAMEIRRLREYSSKQALDIVTLGQELGRLREERPQIDYVIDSHGVTHRSFTLVYKTRAALAEKGEK